MNITLKPKIRRYIEQKLRTGQYARPEDVVDAAVQALRQQELYGEFAPGEMDALLAAGERGIEREGTTEASQVFAELRRRSQSRRRTRKAG